MKYLLSKNLKLLLLTLCVFCLLPATCSWAWIDDNETKIDEQDLHAPEPGLFYIRQTPIICYPDLEPTEDGTVRVVNGILAWADQFSSSELGIVEGADRTSAKTLTYIKLNDSMTLAPMESEKEVVLPVANQDIVEAMYRLPKTTVLGSQEGVFAKMMMPSRDGFAQQDNGIPPSVANQFEMINPTAPNVLGEQYLKVAGTENFLATYTQMEYNKDYMDNWKEFKSFNPKWDDWEPNAHYFTNAPATDPSFVGFYWGRKWHSLLGVKDDYGATYVEPGMISAVGSPINNLKVEITNAPAQAMPGEPVSVSAKITNESNKHLITHLIVKVNGEVVKDIPNFDIVTTQNTAVNFTMPNSTAKVEFLINPNKDQPAKELIWTDNIAVATIIKTNPPPAKEGSIKVTINPPKGKVEPFKDWNFTVRVTGYFPPPPPDSDESNTATVNLRVTGQSKLMEYKYSNGNWGDVIITRQWPVNFDKTITFNVERGRDFDVTKTFTFPQSAGFPGQDFPIPLHAKASWRSYSGEDSKSAIMFRKAKEITLHLIQ